MRTYIKIMTYLLFIASCISLIGCSEDEITKFPVTGYSSDNYWKTELEIEYAANNALSFLDGVDLMRWDGLTEVVFASVDLTLEATSGALGPGATIVNDLWTNSYTKIRAANLFFDNLERSNFSTTDLTKYMGPFRFVRAWAYYRLLYSFGDVPLITKTLKINEGEVPQAKREEVLTFVLSELDKSIAELSSLEYKPTKGMITKWAALSLKSRILLYEGTLANDKKLLQQCETTSKQIIDEGGFELYDNYTMLFRPEGEESNEIILSRVYVDISGRTNPLTSWLAPTSFQAGWSQVTPTNALRDMYLDLQGNPIDQSDLYDPTYPFVNRDGRMLQTIFEYDKPVIYEGGEFLNIGSTYNFRKYIDPGVRTSASGGNHTDWILFRLGEIFLNYAEAKNEVSGPSQDIIDLINALRIRGGKAAAPDGTDIIMSPLLLDGQTQISLRSLIRRERIVELVGEGILYYDYHRWKLLETTMNKPATAVAVLGDRIFTAPRDYLWPIPEFELINNKLLEQNKGWD